MGKQWLVVAASFCGLFIGAGTMGYVLAVFLPVVTRDLGISRGTFSTGILIYTMVAGLSCPFLGAALDRWGSRRVLPPLIACFAACTAAFSLLQPSNVPMLMGLFALSGLTALGLTAVPFARSVSLWFEERRGLALGIAIAGQGFGVAVLPQAVGRVIANSGWRTAYVAYGAAILVIALLPVAIFLREPSKPARVGNDIAAARPELTGVSAGEALTSWRFWAMAVAFFFGVVAVNGTASHMVALLADRGMTMPDAIRSITAVGMAAIIGRLVCGWLLDRLSSTQVALIFFGVPVLGIQLIASGGGGALVFVGAALLGFSIGGEVDMLAFFAGRYFGMKAFGRIYGLMFALFSVGSGVGPFMSGVAFDALHSYVVVFAVFQVLLVVGLLLVSRLGPYRFVSGMRRGTTAPPDLGTSVSAQRGRA